MRARPWASTWRAPNFRYEAKDIDDVRVSRITWAQSSDDLAARLTLEGLKEVRVRPFDFQEWLDTGRDYVRAAAAEAASGSPVTFHPKHWGKLKTYLFELFEDRCAYCEGNVRAVSAGDVEHFRPKRPVSDEPGHPGYYWLAYTVENLLPACESCNRPPTAKSNKFPLIRGTRATNARNVGGEVPALLNPYHMTSATEHLHFKANGAVIGHSAEGRASRATYRLDRIELRKARDQELKRVRAFYRPRLTDALAPGRSHGEYRDALLELEDDVVGQGWTFTSAALDELTRLREEMKGDLLAAIAAVEER